ncbi:hypothetical protein PsorP6_012652 [Peronosclerospora sorghi]|uniref:Uncharacterized protein n=1 Tax=Peronosclerospora sorghi TaxID=230839 RepID=A0ACC0WFV0_9STRA|nr:hypothetical protein PsorP6_012652 [Peronosclerospora sorghi]
MTRFSASEDSDLKELSGRDVKEDGTKSRPARSWFQQLDRCRGKEAGSSFQQYDVQYRDRGTLVARQYLSRSKAVGYLLRLNGEGMRR